MSGSEVTRSESELFQRLKPSEPQLEFLAAENKVLLNVNKFVVSVLTSSDRT